jgi:hypothetical protein
MNISPFVSSGTVEISIRTLYNKCMLDDHRMLEALAVSIAIGLIVPVVLVNFWYWRRRRKMTPQQRAIEDADARKPGDW